MNFKRKETRLWRIPLFNSTLQLFILVVETVERFQTYQDALERISGFIAFYNDTRPHSSIGMKTPSEVHQEQGPQRIMWKTAKELSGAVCPLPQGTP